MLKLGLKNYFKSYRHFFVPIGALALGFVLGISIAVPWILSAIKAFVDGVAELLGGIPWDWEAVQKVLVDELYALNWSEPIAVLEEVFSKDYLLDLLRRCAEGALGDTSAISSEVERLANEALSKISASVAVSVLCTILGAIVGFGVTRVNIRRDVARRKLWKYILISLLDSVINVTFLAFATWLIAAVEKFAILAFLLSVFAYGSVALLEAYLVHGYKKVPLKKVMQVRNFFTLFLLDFIQVIIAVVLFLLVLWITNLFFALFVGFSIAVITVICITLNAEAYVKDLAATYTAPNPSPEAQAAAPLISPAEAEIAAANPSDNTTETSHSSSEKKKEDAPADPKTK